MTTMVRVILSFSFIFNITLANAATVYHSQTDFLSALGGSPTTTQDFEGLAAGDTIADGDTVGGATYSGYNFGYPIIVDNYFDTTSGSNYIGVDDGSNAFYSGDEFTITFDQTLQAAGLYILTDAELWAGDVTLSTSSGLSVDNSDIEDLVLADGSLAFYLALIADDSSEWFNSITLSSLNFNFLYNIDDITVASASVVPLPAAAWLFGSGLLFLAGLNRRTRKS